MIRKTVLILLVVLFAGAAGMPEARAIDPVTMAILAPVAMKLAEGAISREIGGGIRSMKTVETYLSSGLDRVILGTAAVSDPDFVKEAVRAYGEKIAVGVDLKDGYVAVRGWMEKLGVRNHIVEKDGDIIVEW